MITNKQLKEKLEILKNTMKCKPVDDVYSSGFHNGMELAVATIEGREPDFLFYDNNAIQETEREETEAEPRRTIYSGIIY